jgi:hypothetical protein
MSWYNYIACFFAGMFLANAVPHFVQGVSGNKFPSPFSKPPGKGLSSAPVNTVWALFNMLAGYFLFRAGEITTGSPIALILFFAGIAAMSIMLSVNFQSKHAN